MLELDEADGFSSAGEVLPCEKVLVLRNSLLKTAGKRSDE